jgi:hypothetical protein
MPRNVRNFWLELKVDGKKSKVATGPVAKDGGFTLVVRQRCDGGITKAGTLRGVALLDGTLKLDWDGGISLTTKR